MNLPISWTDSELEELEGSEVHTHVMRLKEELPEEFQELQTKLREELCINLLLEFEQFLWAWSIYSSRVMSLTTESGGSIFAIVPGLDMFNHSPGMPTGLFELAKDHVIVKAGEDLMAGEQAYINYADMYNSQMILSFGFLLDERTVQSSEITLSLQVSKAQLEVHRRILDATAASRHNPLVQILHVPEASDTELIVKHAFTLQDPLPLAFLSMVRIQHLQLGEQAHPASSAAAVELALRGLPSKDELHALFLISALLESKLQQLQASAQQGETSHSLARKQNRSEQQVLQASLEEARRLQLATIRTGLKSFSSKKGYSEGEWSKTPWLPRLRAASSELHAKVSSVARLSKSMLKFLPAPHLLQACHLVNLWMVGRHEEPPTTVSTVVPTVLHRFLLAEDTWPFETEAKNEVEGRAGSDGRLLATESARDGGTSPCSEGLVKDVSSTDPSGSPSGHGKMNFEDLSNPLLSLYDEKMSLWGSWLCAQWLHCEAVQLEDWSSMGEEQVKIRNEYSWSVPTEEALRLLALHQPLVELGAGAGYWASLLKQLPVDILAFDEKHFRSSFNERANISQGQEISFKYFCEVLPGGPEMISQYPDRTLVLMWPDYMGYGTYGLDCLHHYKGDKLILIGEWRTSTLGQYTSGISNHGQSFSLDFQLKVEEDFQLVEALNLPTWPLFLDRLHLFVKNERP
ncbi:unnamed protein product [Durusdinium trenchii]|uniref:SET domain-containing protein n=1 Tax=Durusdinium trenchii TaxID=1381693 RepID=A0ABP0P9S7_9DINO